MNFSSEEIQNIIEVVAAMLLMGNLNFERDRATSNGSGEKSKVQNRKILSSVARLLKIEESELEKSLTQRIVNAKGDSVKCALNTDEAQQAQKSFVKVLVKKILREFLKFSGIEHIFTKNKNSSLPPQLLDPEFWGQKRTLVLTWIPLKITIPVYDFKLSNGFVLFQ